MAMIMATMPMESDTRPRHHQPRQHVAAELVGAKDVSARQRRREPLHDVDIGVVERQKIRAERRTQDEDDDGHAPAKASL